MKEKQSQRIHAVVTKFIKDSPGTVSALVQMLNRNPALESTVSSIIKCYLELIRCFDGGHKLLICGNGGSLSDALHLSAELLKSFQCTRKLKSEDASVLARFPYGDELSRELSYGLPVIVLGMNHSLISALENDVQMSAIAYAQELYALGQPGDVLLGISTSGNARNVIYAMSVAKAKGIKTCALTGKSGGEMATIADNAIQVPEVTTARVQEMHIQVYHTLCEMIESHYFATNTQSE